MWCLGTRKRRGQAHRTAARYFGTTGSLPLYRKRERGSPTSIHPDTDMANFCMDSMEPRMTTARLFKLGNSQAVRIPARYRINAQEVDVFRRDGDLVLRPKLRSAADLFAQARSIAGERSSWQRPKQGKNKLVASLG